jgi:hypothetical protein
MVGEAAAGEEQRAGAGGPQDGCGDLCRVDSAEDIDVIRGPEPSDRRVEDLARIRQGSVVHDDAGGAWGAEDPLERRTVAVQVFDVCAHGLDLKPVATQLSGELLKRFAAGDECTAEAFAAEAPNDAGADAGSGPDQDLSDLSGFVSAGALVDVAGGRLEELDPAWVAQSSPTTRR